MTKFKKMEKVAEGAPPTTTRPPTIEWLGNPGWTWALVNYLTDHPIFREKLFSYSTTEANKDCRKRAVGQVSRPQQYAVLKNEPRQSALYAANPTRFATSVEIRLSR